MGVNMKIWSHPHNGSILVGYLWSSILLWIIANATDRVMIGGAKIVFWLEMVLITVLLVVDTLTHIADRVERKQQSDDE